MEKRVHETPSPATIHRCYFSGTSTGQRPSARCAATSAIAAIRTLLNYFLTKEIESEKAELAARGEDMPPLPTPRH